jgi:transcriptional regulator with XRE-family HTH domain
VHVFKLRCGVHVPAAPRLPCRPGRLTLGVRFTHSLGHHLLMTPSDVRTARQELGYTPEQLAQQLSVPVSRVHDWERGASKMPRRLAQQLAWEAAVKRRNDALDASGLPECAWAENWANQAAPTETDALTKHCEALTTHARACSTCQARQRFADNLAPLPELPRSLSMQFFMRAADQVQRLPTWLRPAAIGAIALIAIVMVRAAFAIPRIIQSPAFAGELLLAILAAGGAGAAGGLAYSATRPTLLRLGRPGDYLTGIVCVMAYMGALLIAAPYAFGESIANSTEEVVIFLICSIFFGLVVGHSWFKSEESPQRQPQT